MNLILGNEYEHNQNNMIIYLMVVNYGRKTVNYCYNTRFTIVYALP